MVVSADREKYTFSLPKPADVHSIPVWPKLLINLYVVGKLDWLLKRTTNEVGGFMISEPENPLIISDLALVKQTTSHAAFSFDDEGIVDYMMRMRELKLDGPQCMRIYFHTHPVMSAEPSGLDDQVFEEKFCNKGVPGCCPPWAGQFIRSRTGEHFFKIAFNPEDGPTAQIVCPVEVDPSIPFKAYDPEAWDAEYKEFVTEHKYEPSKGCKRVKVYDSLAEFEDAQARSLQNQNASFFGSEVGSGSAGSDLDFIPERERRELSNQSRHYYHDLFEKDEESGLFLSQDASQSRRKRLEDEANPAEYNDDTP